MRENHDEGNVHFKGLTLTLPETELAHCALETQRWAVDCWQELDIRSGPRASGLPGSAHGRHTTVWEPRANTPPSANQADAELRDHPTAPRDMPAY